MPCKLTDVMGHREQLGHNCSHWWKMTQGRCTILLQKDVSSRSWATVTIKRLQKRFGERFIARSTSATWSPRSPDLTPPAFYLWGHVKEGTYKREPRDLPELKTAVTEYVRAVTARECRRVLARVQRRVEICLARNGRHSDQLLWFPGRGSNGDDKRWVWISNVHWLILAPNNVCAVINTRAGSERNVSVLSETPCIFGKWKYQDTVPQPCPG